jgi:signal transduction histidine kinase
MEGAIRKPLRVLLVEDSDEDAVLVIRELKRGGYEPSCARVQTPEDFKTALVAQRWDIIISDHTLPRYGGLEALADLRATGKDIPFILISGTIGESVAVAAMKAGAQDYVLKGDLTRLPVAVEREVRETAVRADQVKMRERLVISERMASAGMLAAGVAHEINNPLAVAVANVDLIAEAVTRFARGNGESTRVSQPAAGSDGTLLDLEEPLRDAREALQRIRDIVRDVKLFSRPDDQITSMVDLRRVADSSARMAWNEIRHRARLVKHYDDVPLVQANESRLGQVVLNLLINAAQALPEGHADRDEIRVTTRTSEAGDAILEIADTGCGIPPENLTRIFDPFFTTKPIGVGTGLGLAICHGIVTELGGRMEVESRVGKGTIFRIDLPAAHPSSGAMKVADVASLTGVRARVLIVDDELALGRALRRGLSSRHDVTVLTSGQDALARIADGEHFDAILLDVMMPEMSGMEVYERLHRLAPDQARRIIFLTGGAFSARAREFLDCVPNPRLEKPVETNTLLAVVAGLARPGLGAKDHAAPAGSPETGRQVG